MFFILLEFMENVIAFLKQQKIVSLGRLWGAFSLFFFFKAVNINYENGFQQAEQCLFPEQGCSC